MCSSDLQSLFDQFFGRFVEKDVLVKTNSATITIDSPPNLSKNLDYSGGVGQFKFTAKADKSELKSNEAFNFDLSVSGTGNIQLLELPKVEFPADFEVYDPKITDKKSVTSNGISGRKTYNYLIIPRHSGEFTIPALQFTYYDTQTKNYKTITQGPFEITVEKGNNEEETTAIYNGNNKEDLKIIGSDIRYIHTNTTLNASKSPFFNTLPYYLCLAAPFLLLGIFLGGRKQIASANLDTIGNRRKKATKVATRKLASAKKHLEQNEKDAFFEEVIHAIYGYFEDKFNIAAADIGLEIIEEKLNTINFDSEQTTQLKGIIEKCEMARFAPITDNTPEGIYEETLTIISNIEAQVK